MTRKRTAQSLHWAPKIVIGMFAVSITLFTSAQIRPSSTSPEKSLSHPEASPAVGVTGAPKSLPTSHGKAKGNDSWRPPLPLFVPAVAYDAKASVAYVAAVGDLNHDGHLDVIVADLLGVGVFLGNGDGTLQPVVTYDVDNPGGFSSATIADLNGDGHPDIMVATQNNYQGGVGTIAVLLGNGDGTFQPAVSYDPGGCAPQDIVVADVNRDGKPDLVVTNLYANNAGTCYFPDQGVVSIFIGKGDGTFETPVTYNSGGYDTSSVAVADVNRDGKLDLIVTSACTTNQTGCVLPNLGEGTVGVLLGNGDGTFQPAVNYDAAAAEAGAIVAKDLNGDGKLDLVVSSCPHNGAQNCYWSGVSVFMGNGDGTFQPAVIYLITNSGGPPPSLAVADLDEDGKLDIAADQSILLGNGDGTFQLSALTTGSTGWGINIADLNGDGLPDLVDAAVSGATEVFLHVGNAVATTTLTSTPNPSVYGQATFTANVNGGLGIPTGSVVFYNQSTQSGFSVPVPLVNGVATIGSYNNVDVGTDPIFAAYQGSVTYHPGFSGVINQLVTAASTTTTVVPSANPGFVDKTIYYTMTVTSQYGGSVWGAVACLDNGSQMKPVRKKPQEFQAKYTTPGTHSIACTFAGDNDHIGSSATITEPIFYPTTTELVTSGSPSQVGQSVTYTATTSSTFGTVPNGEIVTFTYGGNLLGTAPTSGGVAALTTAALPKGKRTVKATYPGDANFNTSSANVKQVVEP